MAKVVAAAVKVAVVTVAGGKLNTLTSPQVRVPSKAPAPSNLIITPSVTTLFNILRSFIFCLSLIPALCFSAAIDLEEEAPLSAEQAFVVNATPNQKGVSLDITIAPGYLLYQNHLIFNTEDAADKAHTKKALKLTLPPASTKSDPVSGDTQVYKQNIQLEVSLPEHTDLLVSYQGCSEGGFCYAPEARQIHIETQSNPKKAIISNIDPETLVTTGALEQNPTKENNENNDAAQSESDRLTQILYSQKPWVTLCLFLGLGVLLAFTPCVLPMVPILANILVGSGTPLATRRAIFLASLYILSVAVCYGSVGVMAGLLGNHWQGALQQPPVLIGFSLLLVLFALGQFNLIHLRLPAFLSNALNRVQQIEQKQKQGSALGAITMGAISALVASPCVTPALVGALTYISQTGNALLGGMALFMMSLGMGLPLFSVACVGSRFLPKVGVWMVKVKIVTGIFLLILAGTILWRAMPTHAGDFQSIETPEQLSHVLEKAKKLNKPVILDVYAQWCVSCKRMDNVIFDQNQTKELNANYHLLRLDITKLEKGHKQLLNDLAIIGPPTVIFFDVDGKEVKNLRLVGEVNKPDFLEQMLRFRKSLNVTKKD